ncbi:hypothetical protein TSUD_215540 [Trifolium subterraneum]|uniref:Uncharacterized protein n=1 Tax=Trifolium subterraneum TaxID=3900 RepID=A0A2Z6MCD4_TRISU|nr:hypothetical protein TSUD_215540 [Trifolium subterraneum]
MECSGISAKGCSCVCIVTDGSFMARSVESQLSGGSLRTSSVKETLENQPPILRIDECVSPASINSVVLAERDSKNGKYASVSLVDSVDCLEADQLTVILTVFCVVDMISEI